MSVKRIGRLHLNANRYGIGMWFVSRRTGEGCWEIGCLWRFGLFGSWGFRGKRKWLTAREGRG